MVKKKDERKLSIPKLLFGTLFILLGGFFLYYFVVSPFGLIYGISPIIQISGLVVLCIIAFVILFFNAKQDSEDDDSDFDFGMGGDDAESTSTQKTRPEDALLAIENEFKELDYQLSMKNVWDADSIYTNITDMVSNVPTKKKGEVIKRCNEYKKKIDELKKKV